MSPGSAEEAVLACERRALDRWSAGDPAGYLAAATPDMTYFDDIGAKRGLAGRDAVLAYGDSLTGQIPPHEYDIVDARVQLLGDAAVLTFVYQPKMPDGTPLTPWRATTVHHLRDGAWGLAHAHWTILSSE